VRNNFGFANQCFGIKVIFQVVQVDNAAWLSIIHGIYKPLKNVTV
jgi:hypothetical protein